MNRVQPSDNLVNEAVQQSSGASLNTPVHPLRRLKRECEGCILIMSELRKIHKIIKSLKNKIV